jgi:D-alanyl-D-alanine carboxypeptidase
MLERGFGGGGPLPWLTPSLGTVDSLVPVNADPPNLSDDTCGPHRKRPKAPESDDDNAGTSAENSISLFAGLQPGQMKVSEMLAQAPALAEPVVVYTGPTKTGAALIAANAADSESQTPKAKGHKGKLAGQKGGTPAETASTDAKPADTKQAAAKPKTKPAVAAAKPADAGDGQARPLKQQTAAIKPATTPATAKPAAPKSDAKTDAKTAATAKPAARKDPKKDSKGDGKPVTQHITPGTASSTPPG